MSFNRSAQNVQLTGGNLIIVDIDKKIRSSKYEFANGGSDGAGTSVNLQDVTEQGASTDRTVTFSNVTTAFTTTSNVGIGTTSLTSRLTVQGAAAAPGVLSALRLRNSSDGGIGLHFDNSVCNLANIEARVTSTEAGTDNGILSFSTSNDAVIAERMRIASGGNVGIGTNDPIFPLQVKTNSAAISQALQLNTTDWTTSIGSSFQFGFGAATGDTFSEIRSLYGGYNFWSNLVLQRNGGNVGIGTVSPEATLHANVAGSATGELDIARFSSVRASDGNLRFLDISSNNSGSYIAFDSSGSTSGSYIFRSGGAERVRFASGGNVSIGTENSYGKLSVLGDNSNVLNSFNIGTATSNGVVSTVYNTNQTVGSYAGIRLITRGSGASMWGIFNKLVAEGNGTLVFTHGTGTVGAERMAITSGGNVGIGTDLPSSKLHVVGTSNITGDATFAANIGVGGAAATYPLTAYNSANGTSAAFGGTARGIRIDNDGPFSGGRSTIYGVNNTFYGSYQPLAIGGSVLYFNISGSDKLTIDSSGDATFSSSVTAASFITSSGTTSMPTFSTYTTFYTATNYQTAIYLVTLQLNGYSNYTAYATICQNDSALVIMNQTNTTAYIQVSGLNIQGSQNSGNTQNMRWRVLKIGS